MGAALKSRRLYQIRFDRNVSPSYINEGAGWNDERAKEWLERRELSLDDVIEDGGYIRAKQGKAEGRDVELDEIERGVVVIRCI